MNTTLNWPWLLTRILLGALGIALTMTARAAERIGSSSQPLTADSTATMWTTKGNAIPVCYEAGGYAREKKIIRDAIAGTWEFHANLSFTGWGTCPKSGDAAFVRIRISSQGKENSGSGGSARTGTRALSKASDNNPGVNFSIIPDGTADRNRLEYTAVHEFGHVLGFLHEQDAPGNEGPAKCNSGLDSTVKPTPVTAFDRDSIMNYCNRDGNGTGHLTDIDIAGIQKIYGERRKNIAAVNSCNSTPRGKDKLVSVAAPWNDGGRTSVAVFPSDGTKFLSHSQWSVKDGGWGNEVKWVSGDFNGDGKADLAAVWNQSGQNVITVRMASGNKFSQAHWAIGAGGWMDSTTWVAGDFNGDGLTDLAAVWNNGGLTSIAVYLSDGKKFLPHSQWADRDGGWDHSVKWLAGDFNDDGRTDIGAAWNNDGVTVLTVRQSTGSKFTPSHWSLNAGRWFESAVFVAGDFNGDGRTDIARMWNDVGNNTVSVSLSNGNQFFMPALWAERDGGIPISVKWVPGDFNGDGKTDIGAVWNMNGQNVLTVRQSTGNSFNVAHWATGAGGWDPTAAWCSGIF